MTAIAARRRRRTWYALLAGVLVLATVPVLGIAAWRAIRDSESARDVTSTAAAIPVTPTALLAGVDASGQLTTLAMLAVAPDGSGGSIVSVPVGASVVDEDGAKHRLADSYAEGGIDALEADFESVMLVNIDVAQVVDQAQLAALLEPVGPIAVDLSDDVEAQAAAPGAAASTSTVPETATTTARSTTATTSATTSAPELVVGAGQHELSADEAAAVLLAAVPGRSETTRMPATAAVWNGVVGSVGSGRPGSVPVDLADGAPTDLAGFTSALWAGPVRYWQMGATPITSTTENPAGVDLLQVDLAESIMVVATVAPSAASAVLDGASIELISGFDDWTITRDAVALLAFTGANVMVIINSTDPPPAHSEVLTATEAARSLAEVYAEVLGVDTVGTVSEQVQGIEVQITLGQDFADQRASNSAPTLDSIPSPRDTIDKNEVPTSTTETTVGS